MRRWMGLVVMLGVVLLAPGRGRAEYNNDWAVEMQTRLESGDPAAQRKALAEIEQCLLDVPAAAVPQLNGRWLNAMIGAGMCADAARLARAAVLAVPQDADAIDSLLRWRIAALEKANRSAEALADARLLFEICPMGRTEPALLLLAECFGRAYPADRTVVNRLVRQQLAGAKMPGPSTLPATQPAAPPESLVGEIHVDRKPYQAALEQLSAELGPDPQRFMDLAAKGNLLILAGRPAEAAPVFAKLRGLVDYDQLRMVDDALARVLKAQDLTVGRANAYVQSLKSAAAAAAVPPRR